MSLHFEKLSGPIYPAYLVVGDYSIALEPELVEKLKGIVTEENDVFLKDMTDQVGSNRYLREMIQEAIGKAENKAALVFTLRKGLAEL